jgi:uncharacterized protein (TIGR03000 family)
MPLPTELPPYHSPRPEDLPKDPTALLSLRVPTDAEVYIGEDKSLQKGSYRMFKTPPIPPGESRPYQFKVRWTENGKPVERTRKVELHAGQVLKFDFVDEDR